MGVLHTTDSNLFELPFELSCVGGVAKRRCCLLSAPRVPGRLMLREEKGRSCRAGSELFCSVWEG
jgi:hypothetical protein